MRRVLYSDQKSTYFDRETNRLVPNATVLTRNGSICFETNAIGLKGDDIDPSRKLALVWGDSVVFGIGRGWVPLLDELVPGLQFLNGAVEGQEPDQILARAVSVNEELGNVALNIIFPGWHPHGENAGLRDALLDSLPRIAKPVLANMPTALNHKIVDEDLTPYLRRTKGPDHFGFYGVFPYSIGLQQQIFAHIIERNAIMRAVALELKLPFIDVYSAFDSTRLADFRDDFFDVMHPRVSAFPKFAAAVHDGIKRLVQT